MFVFSLFWILLKLDNRGKWCVYYWWIIDVRILNKVIKDWESLNFVYFWYFNWFKIYVYVYLIYIFIKSKMLYMFVEINCSKIC